MQELYILVVTMLYNNYAFYAKGINFNCLVSPLNAVVDCGTPPSMQHADVQVIQTTAPHLVNYTCHSGYQMIGADSNSMISRQCSINATWEPQHLVAECTGNSSNEI